MVCSVCGVFSYLLSPVVVKLESYWLYTLPAQAALAPPTEVWSGLQLYIEG